MSGVLIIPVDPEKNPGILGELTSYPAKDILEFGSPSFVEGHARVIVLKNYSKAYRILNDSQLIEVGKLLCGHTYQLFWIDLDKIRPAA